MKEFEPTWIMLAKIWWLLLWRGLLGGLLIGFLVEFIVASLVRIIHGPFDEEIIKKIPNVTVLLVFTPVAICWSAYAVRMALRKRFRDFRIALVPLDS